MKITPQQLEAARVAVLRPNRFRPFSSNSYTAYLDLGGDALAWGRIRRRIVGNNRYDDYLADPIVRALFFEELCRES